MTDVPKIDIDEAINELATTFAKGLDQLAAGSYLRGGVIKEGIKQIVWRIYDEMPDQRHDLAEALEDWSTTVQDAIAAEPKPEG